MKKLYFCLWLALWAPTRLLAQVSDPTRATLDNIFAPLDKSQIPTGRLFEAAVPLANLPGFDGVLHDSARTDMHGFRLLFLSTAQSALLAGYRPASTPSAFCCGRR